MVGDTGRFGVGALRPGSPNRRQFFQLGAGAAAGWSLAGPALAQTERPGNPPDKPRGQLIAGLSQEPTVLHPLMPGIDVDQSVWWQLFSPLWIIDPEGNFVPDLAREIPTIENGGLSADGLTWKIKLRSNVKWHDGAPFTADDVKFSLDLINNPDFRARSRIGHDRVKDIKVVAPDEIHWRMASPYSPYMSILSLTFMVPKHILERVEDPNASPFHDAPVGTGPFRWGERVSGDRILLNAHAGYHGRGPYVERVVFKYIPDLTVLYRRFRDGQVDYTGLQGIQPNFVQEAKTLKGRKLFVSAVSAVEHIGPNLEFGPFADRTVREALYLAVNKQAVIDALNYGLPRQTESFVPQQAWSFQQGLPQHIYDPTRANALLDAAGWVRGSDGVREKGGIRLEFTNSTAAGNAVREQTQQLLIRDWRTIGATMRVKNMPAAVIFGEFTRQSKFNSLLVAVNFMLGSDPDVTTYFDSGSVPARGGRGTNVYQYKSAEADRLLAEGARQFDRAQRKATYGELQRLIRSDLAILPLFQHSLAEGLKEGLQGFRPNINISVNCWNMREWYWTV
ncbi:peptide ABC transporter substrate-binding protein [Bradyrhizobium diazoefficiens]|nr:peptide ABC transporter substrate-binding protein [Bradyrhizobium diazoefficiens]MBR0846115.1 peptide ABC transporter substrate-binding protein [Bradyrhizobium diazoefficiens]